VRSSVSARLRSSDRAAAHQRAARALTDAGAAADRIAVHLLVAPPRTSAETVDILRRRRRARARAAHPTSPSRTSAGRSPSRRWRSSDRRSRSSSVRPPSERASWKRQPSCCARRPVGWPTRTLGRGRRTRWARP
jgi:hypothetical protein